MLYIGVSFQSLAIIWLVSKIRPSLPFSTQFLSNPSESHFITCLELLPRCCYITICPLPQLSYRALFVSSPVLPELMSNRFPSRRPARTPSRLGKGGLKWEKGVGGNVGKAIEWALQMCEVCTWRGVVGGRGKVGIWRAG